MSIYHVEGFATAAQAAGISVKPRTIRDRIKRGEMSWVIIDGLKFVQTHQGLPSELPQGINLGNLQWVDRCAQQNKITPSRLYEQIIAGNISGVVLGGRVFVIADEPALITFLNPRKKAKQ